MTLNSNNILDFAKDPTTGGLLWILAKLAKLVKDGRYTLWTPTETMVFDEGGRLLDKDIGSKGGKRGGRGRPVSELTRLGARLEELADKVLSGEVDRGDAAVAGQLLGTSRACLRDVLSATEEQLREQVEELEAIAEEQRMQDRERGIKRGWGGAR